MPPKKMIQYTNYTVFQGKLHIADYLTKPTAFQQTDDSGVDASCSGPQRRTDVSIIGGFPKKTIGKP
jgi:hypothetical protein